MKDIIFDLYQKNQTVFTFQEISLFYPKINKQSLKDKLRYAVKKEKLLRLRRGIYAKKDYLVFELANKIYTPSYISLETVLEKEGIIFQKQNKITVVSYLSRDITVDNHSISYRKIKNEILINHQDIVNENNYFIASKERAFLDAVFLFKDYHFDNLNSLDWEKIFKLLNIYKNKTLEKRINEYYQIFKNTNL